MQSNAALDTRGGRPTQFSEAETNSYLKFKSAPILPTGLTEPAISLLGDGRVTGRAVVDLDVVRQRQSSAKLVRPHQLLDW